MRVTLLGKASGHKLAGRLNCRPGEIWGLNFSCLERPMDRVFDIHDIHLYKTHVSKPYTRYIKHINDNKLPFVTIKEYPEIPTSERFPLEDMPVHYFNSSFDYMIAYAWWYGVTEIQIFGCKVVAGGSHEHARPSIEFWIGFVLANGIKVTIYEPTDVCMLQDPHGRRDDLYGFKVKPDVNMQIRRPAPAL